MLSIPEPRSQGLHGLVTGKRVANITALSFEICCDFWTQNAQPNFDQFAYSVWTVASLVYIVYHLF